MEFRSDGNPDRVFPFVESPFLISTEQFDGNPVTAGSVKVNCPVEPVPANTVPPQYFAAIVVFAVTGHGRLASTP